jgi:ATP-dependent Clp protease ATP-binding subunit ClpA
MVTATQSAHERELSARLRKATDQRFSAVLDSKKRSSTACHFEEALREKIVGQEEAVQALVDLYQVFCAGLHSPGRPVGNLLFLGDSRAVIKVDCAEFQHSHEIAKLIGSPPGYLGHRETHPLITQEALAASYRCSLHRNFPWSRVRTGIFL